LNISYFQDFDLESGVAGTELVQKSEKSEPEAQKEKPEPLTPTGAEGSDGKISTGKVSSEVRKVVPGTLQLILRNRN